MKHDLPSLVADSPILPVLNPPTVEQGVAAAAALKAGGIMNAEVVLRSEAALETITAIREAHPDMLVGVGTLLTSQQVQDSINAGAQFLVSPATTDKMLECLVDTGLPMIPGTATPTDVARCYEAGVRTMKFFPAEQNGGAPALKALSSVFQDVKFCPTGGVGAGNMATYFAIANVFAVGGSWMLPGDAIKQGDWGKITEISAAAIAACKG